ncbi:hypothetical protein D3C72_2149510 [compost metagenome]
MSESRGMLSGSIESVSSGGSRFSSPSSWRIDSRSSSRWVGFCGGFGVSMVRNLKFDSLRIITALAVTAEILPAGGQ